MSDSQKRIRDFLKSDPEILGKYDAWFRLVYNELISLQHAIFFLEKISNFPFKTLRLRPEDCIYWTFQVQYLRQYIVIALYRLIVAEDGLALARFRGAIRGFITDEQAKSDLAIQAKAVNFHKQISELKGKIEPIRNKYVAHLSIDLLDTSVDLLPIADMRKLLTLGHDFFNALEFDVYHKIWLWDYADDRRRDDIRDTDFDTLLLATARQSYLVWYPLEKFKEFRRLDELSELTDDELRVINEYRIRCGNLEINRRYLRGDG